VNANCGTAAEVFWSTSLRVFDLDGTLVDTLPDLFESLNAALAELSLPSVALPIVRASLHGGLEGTADAALQCLRAPTALRDPLIVAYRSRYEQNLCDHSRIYEGAQQLLEQLQNHNATLAICSNKPEKLAKALLDRLNLLSYFDLVVGGDSCARCKPHPSPLLHAIERIKKFDTQRALLVGDSAVDRDCAAAAGVPFVYFAGGYGDLLNPSGAPVAYRFDHYQQLHQPKFMPPLTRTD
jgi:phosphoglycolate phosphatase